MYIFIGGGGWKAAYCNFKLSLNDWHHVVGTYNGGWGNAVPFCGYIDEVKIYNYALNQDEINVERDMDEPGIYAFSSIESWTGHSPDYAVDREMETRWGSKYHDAPDPDNEYISIKYDAPKKFNTILLYWEYAYGKEYEIHI